MLIWLPWLTDCDSRPAGWISGFRWGAPLLMVARVGCVNDTPSRQEPILSRAPGTHALDQPFRRAGREGSARGGAGTPRHSPNLTTVSCFEHYGLNPKLARHRPGVQNLRFRVILGEGWGRHPSPQPKFDDSFVF